MSSQDRSTPLTTPLAEVRDAAVGLLDAYEAAEGVGAADDYDPTPRVHPMAEGKYLLACAELADASVLSPSALQRKARVVVERLGASDVGRGESACWGLGFAYRDLPADEPFTITTSMVLNGLNRVAPHLSGNARAACESLRERASRWLLTGVPRVESGGVAAPAYSPGFRFASYNVMAYWCGALAGALADDDPRRAEIRAVAGVVNDAWVDLVGWPYDASSDRADLVHNCYIGWGLRVALPQTRPELDLRLLTMLSQFGGPSWYDAYDIRETADVLRDVPASSRVAARVLGARTLVGFDRPARAWSVGEALVLLGELSVDPEVGDLAYRQLRALASVVVQGYLPEARHRHGMHLAHGLAGVVRRARERRQTAADA